MLQKLFDFTPNYVTVGKTKRNRSVANPGIVEVKSTKKQFFKFLNLGHNFFFKI